MKTNKINRLILWLLFGLCSFTTFAKNTDDPIEVIKANYIKIGAANLNKLMLQNQLNEQNGHADKNVYVFDFKEVLLDPTTPPVFVRDFTSAANRNRLDVTFEEKLNTNIKAINDLIPAGKPKIYIGVDAYLGFAYTNANVLLAGTPNTLDGFTNALETKKVSTRTAIENAYNDIFRKMEAFIATPLPTEGAEVIALGMFDKYTLTKCDFDNTITTTPIISNTDAYAGTYYFKNYEYYNPSATPAQRNEFDTKIRPTAFYNLPSLRYTESNAIGTVNDPKNLDLNQCVDFGTVFATNIKEALLGNIALYDCANYPSSASGITITSITDPVNMKNYLLRFRTDCFKKITLAERKHIFTVIKNAGGAMTPFFETVSYSDFGGETIANAVLINTPDSDQKAFLDYIRDNDILMPILNILSDVGFLNRETLVSFSLPLIDMAARKYPFDNNYSKYLDAVTDNDANLNQFQKSTYYWRGSVKEALRPTKFLPEHVSNEPQSALSGKFCFNKGIDAYGKLIQRNSYDPYEPFIILSEENTLPYADLKVKKQGDLYIVAVPSLYLYVIQRVNTANINKKIAIGTGGIIGVYAGGGMIVAGEAFGMTGAVPIVVGTLEVVSSLGTLGWEFTDVKNNLKRQLLGKGYSDAEADEFVNNIEKIITVAGLTSGAVGLADLAYNVTKAATFWRLHRQVIRDNKLLLLDADLRKSNEILTDIENLLSPTLAKTAGNALEIGAKLDAFIDLKFITNFMRSHVGERMTDEIIKALEKGTPTPNFLTKFNQNPELLYKLGDITGLSETGILTRLKSIYNGGDEGILKIGAANIGGGNSVLLFSKIKNEANLTNIKSEFVSFSDANKTKFLDDFKNSPISDLKVLDSDLINVWKGVKHEIALRNNITFLKNLSKAKKSNLPNHLKGEIINGNKAVGLHIIGAVDNVRARILTPRDWYSNGELYKANIQILDSNGNWITKGPFSTFFDASYDSEKAIEKAAAIISNPINKIADRTYKAAGFDGKTIVVTLEGPLNNLTFGTMYLEPL